jgi:hypothetical protein
MFGAVIGVVPGSGWVPVGLAVFKTVAGRSAPSWVGSTPSHSRQSSRFQGGYAATSATGCRCGKGSILRL